MFCENLQFNLSLYADDCLDAAEREVLDAHLVQCPLCRVKLSEFQALRNDLRLLSRPELSNDLLNTVRNVVAVEISAVEMKPTILFKENFREWLQMRLMPYTVGVFASLFFGFTLLWSLLSVNLDNQKNMEFARNKLNERQTLILANSNANEFELTEADFAAARLSISNESPTVNPTGALVALTKSLVRGNMKNDEVVVVADVFGNGLAQIAEVVEPKNDWKTVNELERALKTDPDFAPFIPAKADHRSETVRVIFKIQKVEVDTQLNKK